jgi:parvulin-like peptidyl-prolyl isomerase
MKRFIIVMGCVALLTGTAFADDTPVVAKIGDKTFTVSDVEKWLSYNSPASGNMTNIDNKKKAAYLNQIVTGMVIADIARKNKFDEREDIKEKMDLVINNFLTIEYLDKVVSADVKASEDDIHQYYEQHKDDFKVSESVHARHILIKADKTASEEEKAEALKKAESVLTKIQNGGDFHKLALEHSQDPGSKTRGGDLGFFGRGRMVREFENVAFSLQPGEMSDIVETNFGYHIIKVESRRNASVKPVEEVKSIIESKLTKERRRQAVDEFVQKAMKDADADVDVRALVGSDPHFGK